MGTGSKVPRRISRVQLGMLLREWRDTANFEPAEVAGIMHWHISKVSKVERGAVTITPTEVDRLIDVFEIPSEASIRIRTLAEQACKRGPLADVPHWAQTYVDLARNVDDLRCFSDELVPSILQTEGYARALLTTGLAGDPARDLNAAVDLRLERQKRLHDPQPPRIWVVMGEGALYRQVGGPVVLREQLERMVQLVEFPHVTIQVVPYSHGEHISLGMTYEILEFADPHLVVVYVEGLSDAQYYDRSPHVATYCGAYNMVLGSALPERETMKLIDHRIKELTRE